MRMFRFASVLTALAVLAASVAVAQAAEDKKEKKNPPVRAFGGGGIGFSSGLSYPTSLLRIPAIQEDLKLSDEQKKTLKETSTQLGKATSKLYAGLRDLKTKEERTKKYAEIRKKLEPLKKQANEKIEKLLKPAQSQRLQQISLQTRGIRALQDKKVAGQLKLSDEQTKKIADVFSGELKSRSDLYKQYREKKVKREDFSEKSQAIGKKATGDALAVLNKEQQAAYEKLKGKKFEWPKRQLRKIQVIPRQKGKGGKKPTEKKPAKKQPLKKKSAARTGSGGGYSAGLGFPTSMLFNPAVQKDLNLSDEQKKALKEMSANLRKATSEAYAGLGELKEKEARMKKYAEARKKLDPLRKQTSGKIEKILKPEQNVRMRQILLQTRGIRVLQQKEIVEKLKITDDQQKKIAAAFKGEIAKRQELYKQQREKKLKREDFGKKYFAISAESAKEALAVLNKDQQAGFEKLKGKKFEWPKLRSRTSKVGPKK